jgi:hypothetical protein
MKETFLLLSAACLSLSLFVRDESIFYFSTLVFANIFLYVFFYIELSKGVIQVLFSTIIGIVIFNYLIYDSIKNIILSENLVLFYIFSTFQIYGYSLSKKQMVKNIKTHK